MSRLNDLLKNTKVDYKPLWQVTIWDKKFNSVGRNKQPNVIDYHYFLAGDLKSIICDDGDIKILTTNKSNFFTKKEYVEEYISEGEIVCIPWGGNPIVQYYKGKFVTADNRIVTSNNTEILNNKYLYYVLENKMDVISSFYRGSGIKHPDMSRVLDLEIPIPSLEVQCEIVRILDNFAELTAELTAELSLRKSQAKFYHNFLLNIYCGDKTIKLGDICHICRGASPRPINNFLTDDVNGVNWIKIGDIKDNSMYVESTKQRITLNGAKKSREIKPGDFIMSNSMSFGRPYISKIKGCIHDGWLSLSNFESKVDSEYLYYALTSDSVQNEMKKRASFGGAVSNLNSDIVREISIPFVEKDKQREICQILNRFKVIETDINIGLPGEIKLRQQQYEYYRDKLLSFKELNSEN